jgi:hypothetical protein
MNAKQKEIFLKGKGWFQWYHNDYWCNKKCTQDSSKQDYTNYGMSLEKAYEFELNGKHFLPSVAMAKENINND